MFWLADFVFETKLKFASKMKKTQPKTALASLHVRIEECPVWLDRTQDRYHIVYSLFWKSRLVHSAHAHNKAIELIDKEIYLCTKQPDTI
jgi:hypothetical protein